ncbi:MAG: sulfatase-like hydrolase/transferase [Lachnospiraceae bacterium]|nr:sulfatase-like hydrolase/transferase [Lachnospiraceae bacterium]
MKKLKQQIMEKTWLVYPVFMIKLCIYYILMELPKNWIWLPVITFGIFLAVFECTVWTQKKEVHLAFGIFYGLFSFVMAADTIYYAYFGQFVSVNQLWQIGSLFSAGTETNLFGALSFPWGLVLLLDIWPMYLWHKKRGGKKKLVWKLLSSGLLIGLLAVVGVITVNRDLRGDFMRINHLEFVTCHTNDIYTAVTGWINKANIDAKEVKQVIDENVPKAKKEELKGVAEGKNLILIQVESLNTWPIGKEYNGQEITPNINALLKNDTLYFSKIFSSSGKGNTADAEFATLNSLYPTTVRECYRMYVNNTYNGLPWILRGLGYETMAFHGYEKEFWNRNIAYKNQGIQTFYSQSELEMTETSGFGLTDKEMFRQAVDILKEKEQPWFAFMITLTNHIPYELDDDLTSLELAPGDANSLAGRYLQGVRYTDEAIGMLIDYLKEAGLYEDTIIAFYGDHQGLNKETEAVESKMSGFLGRTYDYDEMMRIPFVVHIPGLGQSQTIDTVGGQIDILPTLANLMNFTIKQDYVFGSDLLNIDREDGFYAPVTYMPVGSFIKNDYFYELGRDGTFESGRAVELFTENALSIDGLKEYSEKAKLLIETSKKVLDANLMKDEIEHDN